MEGCEAQGCEAHLQRIDTKHKKESHCSFIQLQDRESLCETRLVIRVNDGINKVVFNINSHCFSSYQIITFILGKIPKIMNAGVRSLQSWNKSKQSRWYLLLIP